MIYIETGSTRCLLQLRVWNTISPLEKRLPDTVFLFWRTTPTLMVGKYQNVLEEVNKPYADAHGIRLVRRMSGGGTIYTDHGRLAVHLHPAQGVPRRSNLTSTSPR